VGSASTPLLNVIGASPYLVSAHMNKWYGFLIPTYISFLITHQLPDNTYAVGGEAEPTHYSSVLAQTIFHELGHASQYQRVGNDWYAKMAAAESLIPRDGGYGNADYDDWGKVQVAESWAEFIGTQYARRRYGNSGFKHFDFSGIGQLSSLSLTNIDHEATFAERWIPNGFYYDLIDNVNTFPGEDNWDNIGRSSIHNIFSVFDRNTNNMCDYLWQFDNTYPTFFTPIGTMFDITNHYSLIDQNNFPCF
jgi:hypothetical protein